MKLNIFLCSALMASALEAKAQIGEPFIHDPSTIAECNGKYYTFGTGEGGLWSADGWTWQGGAVRPGRGAAGPGRGAGGVLQHRGGPAAAARI